MLRKLQKFIFEKNSVHLPCQAKVLDRFFLNTYNTSAFEEIMAEEIFTKRLRMSQLFEVYKNMLTEKQKECMSLYFDEDYSLAEIAENLGVTRQAVFDILKRAETQLNRYEEKLGLLKNGF